jgi:hypothetical protein
VVGLGFAANPRITSNVAPKTPQIGRPKPQIRVHHGVHQAEQARMHPENPRSRETAVLQELLYGVCPASSALHTAEHDS